MFRCIQNDSKCCPAARHTVDFHSASHFRNEHSAQSQPQAGSPAVGSRGEERLKYPVDIVTVNAAAGVGDLDGDLPELTEFFSLRQKRSD